VGGVEQDGSGPEGTDEEHEVFAGGLHEEVKEGKGGDAEGGLGEGDEAVSEGGDPAGIFFVGDAEPFLEVVDDELSV